MNVDQNTGSFIFTLGRFSRDILSIDLVLEIIGLRQAIESDSDEKLSPISLKYTLGQPKGDAYFACGALWEPKAILVLINATCEFVIYENCPDAFHGFEATPFYTFSDAFLFFN